MIKKPRTSLLQKKKTHFIHNQSLSSLFVESAGVAGESYDALPSSPDSPSHRPLLLETPASENAGSESVFGPGTGTGAGE